MNIYWIDQAKIPHYTIIFFWISAYIKQSKRFNWFLKQYNRQSKMPSITITYSIKQLQQQKHSKSTHNLDWKKETRNNMVIDRMLSIVLLCLICMVRQHKIHTKFFWNLNYLTFWNFWLYLWPNSMVNKHENCYYVKTTLTHSLYCLKVFMSVDTDWLNTIVFYWTKIRFVAWCDMESFVWSPHECFFFCFCSNYNVGEFIFHFYIFYECFVSRSRSKYSNKKKIRSSSKQTKDSLMISHT